MQGAHCPAGRGGDDRDDAVAEGHAAGAAAEPTTDSDPVGGSGGTVVDADTFADADSTGTAAADVPEEPDRRVVPDERGRLRPW